jgi:hypothetical protein
VDHLVEGFTADHGATRPGFVGEYPDQDQVMPRAVPFCKAALLVYRAFLILAARIAKVAGNP